MAKGILQTGLLTYDSVTYGIVEMTTGKEVDEIDVTDTNSAAGEKEYLSTGRVSRAVSVTLWKDLNAANLEIGVANAAILDFEGFTYAGSIIWTSFEDASTIDDAIQQTYSGRFTGTVTETPAV
jgi:hypothetical protein